MGQIAVAITAVTFIIIEGRAVLADRYLKRQYEKGRADGREEGIRTASEAWNNRRMEAEAKGEPFTEAPPSQLDGRNRGWLRGRRSRTED
jgi:hypothetical protein